MSVVALPEIPTTRIFELRRDEARDVPYWHEVDTVRERGDIGVVLTGWLYAEETEREAGRYRAKRGDGARAEARWTGEELAA